MISDLPVSRPRIAGPVAGPRQVVVEVAAADVLFLDCQIRGGWGEMFGVVPPYVPGNGVAGVVVSLGDGVDRRWLGIQLELLRSLGAEAVDYSAPDWTQIVRRETGGTGPDVILDGVGGQIGQDAFTVIAPGGRFSAHGAPSGSFAQIDPAEAERRSLTVRGIEQVQFDPADLPPLVEQALAEVSAGRIEPVIGQSFPLIEAAQAHRSIESRDTLGKTLLLP